MAEPKYRSIDLSKAVAIGWANDKGLSTNDVALLQYIASWGDRSQPGAAFAWFPMDGMDLWARQLGVERTTLWRTIKRLVSKGLLEERIGYGKAEGLSGYGIPMEVMAECKSLVQNRPSRRDLKAQIEEIHVAPLHSKKASPRCTPATPDVAPLQHDVLQPCNTDNAVTRGNVVHNPCTEPVERTQSLTGPAPLAQDQQLLALSFARGLGLTGFDGRVESLVPNPGATILYDEYYDPPADDDPDWSKAKPEKVSKKQAATTVLLDHFQAGAERASLTGSRRLPFVWSHKTGFRTNLKRLLDDGHTVEELTGIMDVFFQRVINRVNVVKSDELWKDFLGDFAACRNKYMLSQESEVVFDDDEDVALDRARRLAELREQA